MKNLLAPYSKAVAGALAAGMLAGLAALGGAMADGNLTGSEVVIAAGAGLVATAAAGGAVYAAPKNREVR